MTPQPRILIVDDEPFNIDYLEQELEDLNYETLSASNGREALEKIQSEMPDLVLLDIMMPVMDGFAVLEKVKADPATRAIPIIIISANNDLKSVARGIEMGAEDYLPKPFEPAILHARISSSLEKKELRDKEHLYLQSLERELHIARDIQAEFLPSTLPLAQGWEIAAYFKAANMVAGDYYDAFTLPDGNLVCVVGDVCGKGVGAALFMTLFRSLIRATFTSTYLSSGAIPGTLPAADRLWHSIAFTNKYVATTHEQALVFSTVFIALIDVQNGSLTYINAGNEAPCLLRRDGTVEELHPSGPVVGFNEDAKYSCRETRMEPGDLLVSFTDGIPDSQNSNEEFFGRERALNVLRQEAANAAGCVEQMGRELAQFIGEARQFDDITLMAVRRHP